jgi:hypothetical protein
MNTDEKIRKLLKAGMKISLTDENILNRIEALSEAQIKQIIKACEILCDPKSRRFLVYSETSSDQPPGPTPFL